MRCDICLDSSGTAVNLRGLRAKDVSRLIERTGAFLRSGRHLALVKIGPRAAPRARVAVPWPMAPFQVVLVTNPDVEGNNRSVPLRTIIRLDDGTRRPSGLQAETLVRR